MKTERQTTASLSKIKEIHDRRELSRRTFLRLSVAVGILAATEIISACSKTLDLDVKDKDLVDTLSSSPTYPSPYLSGDLVLPELRPPHRLEQVLTASPSPSFTPTLAPTPIPESTPTPEPKNTPAEVVFYGDRTKPKIYLTVDDCYDPRNVETALNVAEKYKVKLTFFPIGKVIGLAPDLYKEAVSKGHAIENHTWSHEWLSGLAASEIEYQILKQHEAVQNAVGQDYNQFFLRPPGGSGIYGGNYAPLLAVCGKLGYKIAMWCSDSNGWRMYPKTDSQAENYILQNVFRNFFKGAIVLQHAIPGDMIALPAVIQEAKADGWQVDTLRSDIK